jgi:hypothetical protein
VLRRTHFRKAKTRKALGQRTREFIVSQRIKLTSRANFSTLDPLASQHAFFLDRSNNGAELTTRHGHPR